jgi:exodeoxyribonuclease VII small subunit
LLVQNLVIALLIAPLEFVFLGTKLFPAQSTPLPAPIASLKHPFTPPPPSFTVPGMSKPVKAAGPESSAVAEISFEEALNKLGSIVQAMENDDLPLEKLLTQYEEGVRMFQTCQTRLAAAELRIQQIERDAAGRINARPLDIAPNNP